MSRNCPERRGCGDDGRADPHPWCQRFESQHRDSAAAPGHPLREESGPKPEPLSIMPVYGDGSTQLVVPPPMLVVANRAVVDEEPQKTSIPPVLPVTVPNPK